MRTVRMLALGWLFHVKMLSRSAFDGLLAVLWPLFFATVAFFLFGQSKSSESLVYASLGAAVMGVWTATSVPSASALQRARWQGTLELQVAAPAHFSLVLLPMTIATATIGIYCMAGTLLWGRLLFGIKVPLEHPWLFVLSIPATIISIGMLGFLLAVCVVRYRTAWTIGATLEYPVWLVCGFLVPLSLFPGWVRPISWLLAPTWGMAAIRASSLGGGAPVRDVALCLALGAGYMLFGILILNGVLRSARRSGTLSLA
jgi:ABC-2 type transport system permease protein